MAKHAPISGQVIVLTGASSGIGLATALHGSLAALPHLRARGGAPPAIGDKVAAMQAGRQQADQPPTNPQGTLYQAGESGRTRGEPGVRRH